MTALHAIQYFVSVSLFVVREDWNVEGGKDGFGFRKFR